MKYVFYCEHCNYKKYTDGTDLSDVKLIKSSPVQTKIPYYDPVQKKTIIPEAREQPKKMKCPKCGHLITVKKNNVPTEPQPVVKEDQSDGSEASPTGFPLSGEPGGIL
jgi:DNA-directed RNA polymerase subunit M/transcription elongation factor TFIIS